MTAFVVGGLVSAIFVGCFLCAGCIRECWREKQEASHPEADSVFNISGRVQQEHRQWPTHDGRIPVDHLSISNELNNKYNDDPPSYEEAMRLALAASTNPSNDVVPPLVAPTPTSATPGAATTTEAEAPKP